MKIYNLLRHSLFVVGAMLVSSAANAQIGCTDEPNNGLNISEYTVTVTDIRLCTQNNCADGGVSILAQKNMQVRIADLAVGVGNVGLVGGDVPVGKYNSIRMTISRSIAVQGFAEVTTPGGARFCRTHGSLAETALNSGQYEGVDGGTFPTQPTPTQMTMTIPTPSPVTGAAGVDIVGSDLQFTMNIPEQDVKEGYVFPAIDFKFGVKHAIGFMVYAGVPNDTCRAVLGAPEMAIKLGAAGYQDLIPIATTDGLICP